MWLREEACRRCLIPHPVFFSFCLAISPFFLCVACETRFLLFFLSRRSAPLWFEKFPAFVFFFAFRRTISQFSHLCCDATPFFSLFASFFSHSWRFSLLGPFGPTFFLYRPFPIAHPFSLSVPRVLEYLSTFWCTHFKVTLPRSFWCIPLFFVRCFYVFFFCP